MTNIDSVSQFYNWFGVTRGVTKDKKSSGAAKAACMCVTVSSPSGRTRFDSGCPENGSGNAKKTNVLPYDGQAILIDDNGAEFDWVEVTRTLIGTIPWQQETARIFGREMPVPRVTAWFGDAVLLLQRHRSSADSISYDNSAPA
jgi:hypothetical protein